MHVVLTKEMELTSCSKMFSKYIIKQQIYLCLQEYEKKII